MFHLNKVVPIAVDDMSDGNRNVNNLPNDLPSEVGQDTLESRVVSTPLDNDVREDYSVHHQPFQPVVNGCLKRRNSYLLTNELILQNLAHSGDPIRKENLAGYAILETAVDEKEEADENNKASEISTNRHGINDQSNDETSELPASYVSVKCEDPNQALLLYFAKLSSSSEIDDSLDLGHIKSLLQDGASVNTSDRFGQTLLHEVCRTWGIDVAEFFVEQGADINKADDYGRTPLHVAAAADYPEMVRFLLDNGANFNLTTKGEKQTPLHFAARNEAAKSVRVFLAYGADFDVRDYKLRTPLQLAAESNSAESARILLEAGASAGTRDESGMSALTLMVTKMPSVALRALDQFHITDRPHRKQRYYLNFLEHCDTDTKKCNTCTSPLQAVVEMNCFELVMHPIFQRLLEVKWKFFGGWAWFGIFLNVLLAVVYTILGVTHPLDVSNYYFPLKKNGWRMPLEFIVVLLTLNEIRKEIKEIYQSRKENNQWIKWRKKEVKRDLEFCHPRWIQERTFIKQQIRQIKERKKTYFQDKWNLLDWLVYVMLMIVFVLHGINLIFGSERYTDVFIRIMACTLILVWVRLLKFARPFPAQGHFVVILDNILGDTVRWGFVIAMFYIPYAAAFYMMFGDHSRRPVKGYDSILSLAYTVIRYPLVDNYGFDELESAAPIMARVLCGSFLILAAIVLMNLYIALLSNTFQRVYDNARATAAMQRARLLQDLEASASSGKVGRYREHIRERCSPEGSDYLVIISDEEEQNRKQEEKISMVHNIVSDRLGGKKFGKVQKSEFDMILEDIELLKRSQGEVKGVLDRFNLQLKEIKTLNGTLLEEIVQLKSNGQQRMLAIKEVGTSLSDLKTAVYDEFGGLKNDMEANIEKFQADAALRNVTLESSICSQIEQVHSEFNEINLRHDKYEQEIRARVELLEDFILSLEVEETAPEKAVSKERHKGSSSGLHGGPNGPKPLSPPLLKIRPRSSNSEKIGAAEKKEQIEERRQKRSITPESTEGSQVGTTGSKALSLPFLKTRPQSGVDAESGAIDKSKQIEERQRRRPITAETVPGKATSKGRPTDGIEGSHIDTSGTKPPQFPVLKTRPQSSNGTEIGAIDKNEQIEERQRRRTITAGSKEARDQYLSKLRTSLMLSPKPHQEECDREGDA